MLHIKKSHNVSLIAKKCVKSTIITKIQKNIRFQQAKFHKKLNLE